MITRLQVSGFKNLVGVDVRFGSFTCIAGANGAGKSNLFDAISFLSALADRTLLEAAALVRSEEGRGDLLSLFTRRGDERERRMTFEVEMVVPAEGTDDLGQPATASITFLRYRLALAYREGESLRSPGRLEIEKEELTHINIGDAKRHLTFPHSPGWRKSAVRGRRTSPFISTAEEGGAVIIRRHQEGNQGRPLHHAAAQLPRTVLSVANAAESPTALLARREMQSWRLLQLEPSALRRPDDFAAPPRLGADGSHLPATLYRLAHGRPGDAATVYARVANRLAELIEDVRRVYVDRDDKREVLTLQVQDKRRTTHSARALSDGTLRFLALAVLELDPEAGGVFCFEEPENGIHPARIEAILDLLQSIATDPREPVDADNPLRQVIVNTHSPSVVQLVPEDALVVAEQVEQAEGGEVVRGVRFGGLPGTWRAEGETARSVPMGRLLAYLNPVPRVGSEGDGAAFAIGRRVIDRADVRQLKLFDDA